MINAIAVDDEPIALDIIKSHLDKIDFVNLESTFLSASEALAYINKKPVDLIFLDISMPDMSGLEFAGMVKDNSQIIFTTAHQEHALKGFDLAATDYLLKPISFSRFLRACELVEKRLQKPLDLARENKLFVKEGHNWVQINFENIVYIQSLDNYVSIFEKDKRTLTRITLAELQNKLPARQFIRIHKSFIVSLSKIEKIEKTRIRVMGQNIPISKLYRDGLMENINRKISNQSE